MSLLVIGFFPLDKEYLKPYKKIKNALKEDHPMTSIQVKSAQLGSTDSQIISIESSFMRGFSGLSLIGSSSDVCRGGLLRAEASLEACEIKIPQRKIIVSLFPAGHKKKGINSTLLLLSAFFISLKQKKQEKI